MADIPWLITGGLHSAPLGRILAFLSAGGDEGVLAIGDHIATPTSVPSGKVNVEKGAAVLVSTYPGAIKESYIGQKGSAVQVDIDPTTGTARSDLIVARIDDWNYPGQQAVPASLPTSSVDAYKIAVVKGVPAGTATARELVLGYPAIPLARVDVPAGTSIITAGMIVDLRRKASPLRQRRLYTFAPTVTTVLSSSASMQWPPQGAFTVPVPTWASKATVQAVWQGVRAPAGDNYGETWVRLGYGRSDSVDTRRTKYDTTGTSSVSRLVISTADQVDVPAGQRGQSVVVSMLGRTAGGSASARLSTDASSTVSVDIEFLEAATTDV